ncbi:MAG: D-2-hydroxyacid dehydrogenase [Desulfurococcaceae archaeon]
MAKVLVASKIHEKAIELLVKNGFNVDVVDEPSERDLVRMIKGYDAIVVRSKPRVTREVIEAADVLKVIARAGIGLDNIDVETAKKRGITVLNAPESSVISVAELTIGLILDVLRKISYCDRAIRAGEWPKKHAMGFELHGKVIGIIGAGRIGTAVARIARYGFNMRVLYHSRRRHEDIEKEVGAEYRDLESLLREADVVTIHVPLTTETRHLINEERLKLMKRTAILINTSRGGVVDTDALIKALKNGWIAGAGLDVFEEEPLPPNHPLTLLDNVVLTAHIGANTWEAQERAGLEIAQKLIDFFAKVTQ